MDFSALPELFLFVGSCLTVDLFGGTERLVSPLSLFWSVLYLIESGGIEVSYSTQYYCIAIYFSLQFCQSLLYILRSFLVLSLPCFGIRLVLAPQNELGTIPSAFIFWKIL